MAARPVEIPLPERRDGSINKSNNEEEKVAKEEKFSYLLGAKVGAERKARER